MRPNRGGAVAGAVYVVLGVGWVVLARPEGAIVAAAWIVAVALVGVFIPGEANQVTLARAYLAAPAAVYAVAGEYGLLAITVAVAGLTDLVDGTVARRLEHPSNFGGGLDPVVDGVFMAALTLGLGYGGAIPIWLALVVIARYLLPAIAGGALIVVGRRPELRHTLTGQVSTVLILVLVGGVCLIRALGQDASVWLSGAEVVIPIATLATYVHLGLALRRPAVASEPG